MMTSIQEKLIAGLAALVLMALACLGTFVYGVNHGQKIERAAWQKVELARKDAEAALVRANDAAITALHLQYEATNRKVSEDHEQELSDLRSGAAADRALVERAGGLRIARTVCNSPAATAETAGTGRRDAAAAATVRLPREVENDLWDLADAADQVTAQARACQAWIRKNGFYGPETPDDANLQGKIVADPTQPDKE
jgi:hypothetical protein